MKGGYSYVCDEGGSNINSVEGIRPDDTLNIYVTDGIITATATKITKKRELKMTIEETFASLEDTISVLEIKKQHLKMLLKNMKRDKTN